MIPTDDLTWLDCHQKDLWIFDKLILSRVLEYRCGPAGLPVSSPDFYCVRPAINMLGMSRHARFEYLHDSTEHIHPSEFWCEIFRGRHLSIDYENKKPILTAEGIRHSSDPLYKWTKWVKVSDTIPFPSILQNLYGSYSKINCEFIDGKLIEVHLRHNPDFQYQNTEAIPVWHDNIASVSGEYRYIESSDYYRKGFLIK
jgi:hypothetical protein